MQLNVFKCTRENQAVGNKVLQKRKPFANFVNNLVPFKFAFKCMVK